MLNGGSACYRVYRTRDGRFVAGRVENTKIPILPTSIAYDAVMANARAYKADAKLNGVLVQDNVALIGATVHGKVGVYTPHAAELPLALQDHGNADSQVSFRNIWVKRL